MSGKKHRVVVDGDRKTKLEIVKPPQLEFGFRSLLVLGGYSTVDGKNPALLGVPDMGCPKSFYNCMR